MNCGKRRICSAWIPPFYNRDTNDKPVRRSSYLLYFLFFLISLIGGNLLIGLRGKGGGYKLTKSPENYTIGSILNLTEGSLAPVACLKENAELCKKQANCKTLPVWKGLNQAITDYLASITLGDIIEKPDNYSI